MDIREGHMARQGTSVIMPAVPNAVASKLRICWLKLPFFSSSFVLKFELGKASVKIDLSRRKQQAETRKLEEYNDEAVFVNHAEMQIAALRFLITC